MSRVNQLRQLWQKAGDDQATRGKPQGPPSASPARPAIGSSRTTPDATKAGSSLPAVRSATTSPAAAPTDGPPSSGSTAAAAAAGPSFAAPPPPAGGSSPVGQHSTKAPTGVVWRALPLPAPPKKTSLGSSSYPSATNPTTPATVQAVPETSGVSAAVAPGFLSEASSTSVIASSGANAQDTGASLYSEVDPGFQAEQQHEPQARRAPESAYAMVDGILGEEATTTAQASHYVETDFAPPTTQTAAAKQNVVTDSASDIYTAVDAGSTGCVLPSSLAILSKHCVLSSLCHNSTIPLVRRKWQSTKRTFTCTLEAYTLI